MKCAPWDLDLCLLDADTVKHLFIGIDQRLWVHCSVALFGPPGANTRGFNGTIFGEARLAVLQCPPAHFDLSAACSWSFAFL